MVIKKSLNRLHLAIYSTDGMTLGFMFGELGGDCFGITFFILPIAVHLGYDYGMISPNDKAKLYQNSMNNLAKAMKESNDKPKKDK
jgi:hypothetical protein